MSRHELPGRDPNHTVYVGYDRGLKTFFGQVEDNEIQRAGFEAADRVNEAYGQNREPSEADVRASGRDAVIFWIGADRPEQVTTVEQLAAALAPYVELTPAMMQTLRDERERAEERPRNDHERAALEYVETGGGRALPLGE